MIASCFFPSGSSYDYIKESVHEMLMRRYRGIAVHFLSEWLDSNELGRTEDWKLAIAWIPPKLDDDPASAHYSSVAFLRSARKRGIPTVGLGASLSRTTKKTLEASSIDVYVLIGENKEFEVEFSQALSDLEITPHSVVTRYYNFHSEIILKVNRAGIIWSSIKGYQDLRIKPNSTHWVPQMIRDISTISKVALSRKHRDELQSIGHNLGSFLLHDNEDQDFYSSVRTVVGKSYKARISIQTDDDWQRIPFELALLPGSDNCIAHLHPMVRTVPGFIPMKKWGEHNKRGLRVLLVLSKASGRIICPQGFSYCKDDQLLMPENAESEISELVSLFEKYRNMHPDLIDIVKVAHADESDQSDLLTQVVEEGPWDIFHYVGHGRSCICNEKQFGCIFTKSIRRKMMIPRQYAMGSPLNEWIPCLADHALVYLSCCKSADSGMVRALSVIKPCETIGFQMEVGDVAASELAKKFYNVLLKALASGRCDVGEAMLLARRYVTLKFPIEGWLAAGLSNVCIGESRCGSNGGEQWKE